MKFWNEGVKFSFSYCILECYFFLWKKTKQFKKRTFNDKLFISKKRETKVNEIFRTFKCKINTGLKMRLNRSNCDECDM